MPLRRSFRQAIDRRTGAAHDGHVAVMGVAQELVERWLSVVVVGVYLGPILFAKFEVIAAAIDGVGGVPIELLGHPGGIVAIDTHGAALPAVGVVSLGGHRNSPFLSPFW